MLKTAIPFIDLRGKTPVDLLRAYPDKAQALVAASRRTYGGFSHAASALALPFADHRSHAWLRRNLNPYLHEIETFADILAIPGIYTLNISYEWGCTSGAYRTGETVTLLRVLDWPFPALGRHVMATLQQGRAGTFHNITWPAVSGVYTAMAPGRFSAAINQAPMRRHGAGFAGDWLKNRLLTGKSRALPPSHLLRQVCEQAGSYAAAKHLLTVTPVALPVIYLLTGVRAGQGCVIERLENDAEVTDLAAGQRVSASNHFTARFSGMGKGWRPREEDSEGRLRQSCSIHGHDLQVEHFDWLKGPMINPFTRLAVIADAATGRLMVQGFEGVAQATDIFHLAAEAYGQQEAV